MKTVSPNNCRIAPATGEDVASISRVAGRIWRACYPGIITSEQIEYMLSKMYSLDALRHELSSGIHYPQLFIDTELAGFASYGSTETPRCFKLHKLYILPQWHRHGFGTLLLNHCECEAGRLGAAELILNVNKKNVQAIAMYQRNGFRITDSVVADIGQGFVMDDYVMGKQLARAKAGDSPNI